MSAMRRNKGKSGEREVLEMLNRDLLTSISGRNKSAYVYGTGNEGGAEMSATQPIFAIDPGTDESGWVWYENGAVKSSGVSANHDLLADIQSGQIDACDMAIEMIASYGMPVGKEVFETCVWIGRFKQAFRAPNLVTLIYRKDVKLHLCGSPRAKDANIRQALIDKLGPAGTKKAPGPTYGVKSHSWAALGVAVTAESMRERM